MSLRRSPRPARRARRAAADRARGRSSAGGARRYAVRFPARRRAGRRRRAATPRWRRCVPGRADGAGRAGAGGRARAPGAHGRRAVEKASTVLVMDESGSMNADDVAPTRLGRGAGRARERFMDRVPDELLVGFVGYSTVPQTVLEPTARPRRDPRDAGRPGRRRRHRHGRRAQRRARPARDPPRQGRRTSPRRRSSCSPTARPPAAPTRSPRRAARGQLEIPIYTVSLGTAEGVVTAGPFQQTIPVPPDPETLRRSPRSPAGAASAVEDADELDRVYQRLGSRIGVKQRAARVQLACSRAPGCCCCSARSAAGLRWRGRLA